MRKSSKKSAVFLDRDGVITELVLNPMTKNYEAPQKIADLKMIESAFAGLSKLQDSDFQLFIVSNQPDFALGKAKIEDIKAIASQVDKELNRHFIVTRQNYYCYHHPNGIVPELKINCECRKPKIQSLLSAARDFDVDLTNSWMIGDQDSDMECGAEAGCHTILILNDHSQAKRRKSRPTFQALNLEAAADTILTKQGV